MAKSKKIAKVVLLQPESKYEMMPIFRLWQDEKQPRKIFEENALAELVESIKSNGIIQPIVVRYHGEIISPEYKKGPQYQIVCGERSYRAAEVAGMEEIPVVIRNLDDHQALEIQIIENLQRKDVHPMEEAKAFKKLAEYSSIEDIAIRVGKSSQTIAQRIKLNDLMPLFQDLLYANKLSLVNAAKLCRFSPESQKAIAKECVPKDWSKQKSFEINDYRFKNFLNDQEQDLAGAPFKTNDTTLYPEAGACTKCPFNSSANKLLFPDLEKKRICHNPVCFQTKCSRAYQRSIEEALTDPELLFIAAGSYPNYKEKAQIKAAEEMGAVVLSHDCFEIVDAPEPVMAWPEYLKENDRWSDDNEYDDAEKKGYEAECRSDYNDEVQAYNTELKEYEEIVASGNTKKAFVVTGSYRAKSGSVVAIVLNKKATTNINGSSSPEAAQQQQRETEIEAIELRERRNKELDREKVFVRSMEELQETFTKITDELHPEEWTALAILIADTSYKARDLANGKHELGSDYTKYELFNELNLDRDHSFIFRMIRIALYDRLVDKNCADFGKSGKAAAMMSLAKLWIPAKVEIFETEQQEKTDKRLKNTAKRIEVLQS